MSSEKKNPTPKYSIIIPTYNHLEDCLKPCIESIIKYTDLSDVEVIIVANGCTDGTEAYLKTLNQSFRHIWIKEPYGYTKSTNLGIQIAKGEFVVLLNNDTILLDSPKNMWLEILRKPFDSNPKIGISGPSLSYCPNANDFFMIFFCVMIRRSLFSEIGILDEIFSPGFGEDTDFCLRAKKHGYEIVQVPSNKQLEEREVADDRLYMFPDGRAITLVGDFPIYHRGEGTFGNWGKDGDELLNRNRAILKDRYQATINLDRARTIEGFMSDEEMTWLGSKAIKNKVIIEVGSWMGRSSRAIGDNLGEDCILYCVDHWQGSLSEKFDPNSSHGKAFYMDGDYAYYTFLNNNRDLIEKGKIIPIRMHNKSAATYFKENKIKADMVFIDAGHAYEEIKEDIKNWLPLVKEGGTICGHDFYPDGWTWGGVKKAVEEAFPLAKVAPSTSIWYHTVTKEDLRSKIYDCFMFFNELDVLEVRLDELYNHVDRFVIVEGTRTFSNKSKPLYFQDNIDRYKKYLDKITYIVVDDFPLTDPWGMERHQRDCILRGLTDCSDDAIIIMGDADEIINPSVLKNYKISDGICSLRQKMYYYYYNCQDENSWTWLKILPYSKIKNLTPCGARYYDRDHPDMPVIDNGGWHFSFIGGVDNVINKIQSYAHQEYNKEEYLDRNKILDLMNSGKDIFGRSNKYNFTNIDSSYPKFIINNYESICKKKLIKM